MLIEGKDLGELLLEQARARYAAGDYEPRTVFVCADGRLLTLHMPPGCDWDDPRHRDFAVGAMRVASRVDGHRAAAVVSECWVRETEVPKDGEELTDDQIDALPRSEALMVLVSTRDGDEVVLQYFTREGGREAWGRVDRMEGGQGRLADLVGRGEATLQESVTEAGLRARLQRTTN